jgi:hypothetical protein
VCEHAFVSIKGGSYQRFRRALELGNPTLVRAAAAELPQIGLEDALGICLLLLEAEPHRFPAAAARWHARLSMERRLALEEADLAMGALRALAGERPQAAVAALGGICSAHGLPGAEQRLAAWLRRRLSAA